MLLVTLGFIYIIYSACQYCRETNQQMKFRTRMLYWSGCISVYLITLYFSCCISTLSGLYYMISSRQRFVRRVWGRRRKRSTLDLLWKPLSTTEKMYFLDFSSCISLILQTIFLSVFSSDSESSIVGKEEKKSRLWFIVKVSFQYQWRCISYSLSYVFLCFCESDFSDSKSASVGNKKGWALIYCESLLTGLPLTSSTKLPLT